MTVVTPFWRSRVRQAQETGDRLIESAEAKQRSFENTRTRVLNASERAESAAVTLMLKNQALARAVARHGR